MTDSLYALALTNNGNEELYSGPSEIAGNGLFTSKDLPSGTLLCRLLGHQGELTPAELAEVVGMSEGKGKTPGLSGHLKFKYLNHSCRPNAQLGTDATLVSIIAIVDGSEILIDYGLLRKPPGWRLACCCGSPDCRHIII
jgi:hypothetical protein